MPDRETVIKGLEPIIGCAKQEKWGAWVDTLEDAYELLKEQEHKDKMFHALESDWKTLKDKLKEQQKVVRCKDCKYFDLKDGRCFNKKSPCRERMTGTRWFCADGEKQE